MSQVAGRMSVQAGATALEKAHGGRGVLLGGVPGILPAKVTVIGGGVVGFNAAQMAVGLGADVTILDRDPSVLERVGIHFESRAKTRFSNLANLQEAVCEADLVIGAVLVPGAAAPKLVTRAMLADMQPGSVLVDVAIDQGGCFETSRATTHVPHALRIANLGWREALKRDPHLANGLNVHGGAVCYEAVAEELGYSYTPLEQVLG